MSGSGLGLDDLARTRLPLAKSALVARATTTPSPDDPAEDGEGACGAFGYLRGTRDKALAVAFRFADGNTETLPYSHLAGWRFDPSVGLLLRYTADVVTLVLVRGSNLDVPVGAGVDLLAGGLQRHRVVWVREMDAAAVKAVGDTGPTVDKIEVAEFDAHADLKAWLAKTAPAFTR